MSYYTATGAPTIRGRLSSEEIRDQWAALETAFSLLPDPLSGGFQGFDGGRWENGTLQGATVLASTIGSTASPCTAYISALYPVAAGITSLSAGQRAWVANDAGDLQLLDEATALLVVDDAGNVIIGNGTTELALASSSGFLYVRTVNGTPSGTPTAYTAAVPLVYDRSANKIGIYNGGWKFTAALS